MKIIAKDVKVGGHDSLNNPTRIMNEVKLMKSLKHVRIQICSKL